MTTVLCIRSLDKVVMIADGQVSLGPTVIKGSANKMRVLGNKRDVLAGFAGATADAFAMLGRLEDKLNMYPNQILRACVELAKDWRTDRYLRRLEAMMIVSDISTTLLLSGNGDVLEPDNKAVAIGSGGNYALAAAVALLGSQPATEVEEVARKAMKIAADLCVYTNHHFCVKILLPGQEALEK